MISRNKILKISSMRRGLLFVAVVTLCFGLCHTREAKVSDCMPHHGGWHWEYLPYLLTSPPGVTFMADCGVWKPSWSSCYGSCGTSHDNVSTSLSDDNYHRDCQSCRSRQQAVWYPNPYCFVVRLNPLSFGIEQLPDPVMDTTYAVRLAHACGCYGCDGKLSDRRVSIDGSRVAGLSYPPPKTYEEKMAILVRAAEYNYEIERALQTQGVRIHRWGG